MIKGIIFDFDYTLGNSEKGIIECMQYALAKLGYAAADEESICRTIGISLPKTYTILTGDTDGEKALLFRDCFVHKADEVMVENTVMFPEAVRLLAEIKEKGIKTGIVTTKYSFRIRDILKNNDMSDAVDFIVGGDDVSEPKPSPEGLLKTIEYMGLEKNEVLYVGDSLVDAETAQRAGVSFAAVTTGTTVREQFADYPHIAIMDSLTELNIEEM